MHDVVIRALFEFTRTHLYPAENPSEAEHMAVVATGGYGRGLMAPGSDIDLLFLLPYKQTAWGEQVAETILYCLWDMGLKVGHATRSVDECMRQAKADMTIRTALLEARYILGDKQLFDEMTARFQKDVVQGTAAEFVDAKLAEREERHRRGGQSRYLVEPNVKDGKGGLRDLHTLFWIAKYVYQVQRAGRADRARRVRPRRVPGVPPLRGFPLVGALPHALRHGPRRGAPLVRHPARDRGAPRLHRASRPAGRRALHEALLPDREGRRRSDRDPVLRSRRPAGRSRSRCSTGSSRGCARSAQKTLREIEDFVVDKNRITVASADVFERDPVNLIRMFRLAQKHNLAFHPDAMRLITRSLKLIDASLRDNPEANKLFLEIMASRTKPRSCCGA